jgi:hypothetical protein
MPFEAIVASQASPDCTTIGIAGTVSDVNGEPLTGFPIHVWGEGIEQVVLSGSAPVHGDSGWEVAIPNPQEPLSDTWYVQLHVRSTFRSYPAVSSIVQVELSADCENNFVLINFQEREE